MSKTILLTGVAGFVGSHAAETLIQRGDHVIGVDNLNDYYDPAQKKANLVEIQEKKAQWPQAGSFTFVKGDIRDQTLVNDLFHTHPFDAIVHLAAMAGVRASIHKPQLYYDVNVTGTLHLLDAAVRHCEGASSKRVLPHVVFASTSSVYGQTQRIPFVEDDACDRPLAPYSASKRGAELLGHSYHHLYKLSFTALRFFTVYGPRGRPDMMAYKVLDNLFRGREVPLYNEGRMHRDWTYIGDIIQGILGAVDRPMGYEVINLGRGEPVLLADFVTLIENLTGRKASLVSTPMLDADVPYTYADVSKAKKLLGYNPQTSIKEGVERFWEWYQTTILKNCSA
ncbi:MAG: SDR family NAD(P)-dependent oxidoreductase [Nitrospirales bacterium]|nr:SDR family NAD(P)-dependent oxidoreductase [Nitrospirales bacterium]